MSSKYKTWIEISRSALAHNFRLLKKISAPSTPIAVIRGNAYGHGLAEVAEILDAAGTKWFGVDWWRDALWLRKAGYQERLLVMGYIPRGHINELIHHNISFVVYTIESLKEAIRSGSRKKPARIHLEIETGFVRQGIDIKDLVKFKKMIRHAGSSIHLEGLMTHFANVEDVNDQRFARQQLTNFEAAKKFFEEYVGDSFYTHTASTAATMLLPQSHYRLTRCGIGLYGLWPSSESRDAFLSIHGTSSHLKAVLTWKARVAQVKRVKRGTPVSYGLTERVKRDSKVAVIPVGYFDGLDRAAMSRRGFVLIGGRRCKLLGRVCMNVCMADATDVPRVKQGDEVVLIGKQGRKEITAEELAELAGTINYEIVTRLNPLIPRMVRH